MTSASGVEHDPEAFTPTEDWRHAQLLAAGWPEPHAFMLATLTEVDLHRACELLEHGCDVGTAWLILT